MLEYRLGSSQKLSLAELTITLDNQTKVYGSADPELTYTVTGLINNNIVQDTEEDLNIVVDRVDGENVGEYAISATAKNDNYVITINEDALPTITKAPVTATMDKVTKTYGEDDKLTYVVDGIINNEIVQDTEAVLEITTGRKEGNDGQNVGTYTVTATVTDKSGNYDVTVVDGELTIEPAAFTVTLEPETITYGETYAGKTYEVTTGIGEDKLSVTTKLADDFTATDAGTYEDAITATVGENTNYTVTVANAALTIAPANITAVEIVIDPATTDVYTAEDQVTITITAKNGDKVVVDKALVDGTYTITTTDAEGNTVAVADLATALQTAGVYTFTPDVNKENKNYVVAADAVKTATLTVEKKTITVTVADIETDTAAPVPTITPVVVDAEGKPVDNADLEITITDAAENEVTLAEAVAKKGTYKITVTVGNENYIVSEQSDLEAILTVRHYVAKVGETKYESLQEAVNVAGANGIVDLLIDTDEIVIVRYPLVMNRVNGATITEGLFTGKGLDYTEDDVAYIVSAITCTPEDLGPAVAYIDINDDGSLNGSEVAQPL